MIQDATKIKRLRSTCQRLYDYCDRIPTHSGIPWAETPLAHAVKKVLAETEPEPDDPLAPCSACGYQKDTPNHELGCEVGRAEAAV